MLPASARNICIDFRGHGESDVPATAFTLSDLADNVISVAEDLTLDKFVLAGHSLGGMVSIEVARRSKSVLGLVLLEGWTRLTAVNAFHGNRFYGRLEEWNISEIKKKDADMRRRMKPEVWSVFWESVKNSDGLSFFESSSIPITEVYGEMGRTESTLGRLMIPSTPMIQLVWIDGTGHYLPHERPKEIADICQVIRKQVGV